MVRDIHREEEGRLSQDESLTDVPTELESGIRQAEQSSATLTACRHFCQILKSGITAGAVCHT